MDPRPIGIVERRDCPSCRAHDTTVMGTAEPVAFMPQWPDFGATEVAAILPTIERLLPNGVQLVRCRKCGLIFSAQVPDPALLSLIYDDLLVSECEKFATSRDGKQKLVDRIAGVATDLVRASAGRSDDLFALDVGAGWGELMLSLRRYGLQVDGVELSDAKRRSLKERGLPAVPEVDALDLAQRYDLITAWQVVEHLVEPRDALARLRELALPHTILLVGVPHFSRKRVERELASSRMHKDFNPLLHLSYFDGYSLEVLASRAGWTRLRTAAPLLSSPPVWRSDRPAVRRIGGALKAAVAALSRDYPTRAAARRLGTYAAFVAS